MSKPDETIATDLEQAWANFDPFQPLPDGSRFYLARPHDPLARLKKELLLSQRHGRVPKYFFSGHRGSGKSTEMNRLAASPEIRDHFVVIYYSIRDYADVNDLNHVDVLFTLGAQMFMQYTDPDGQYKGKIQRSLLRELENLLGRITENVRITTKEGFAESEASLNAYFLKALFKIKQEEVSRREIRNVLEPNSSEWIKQINLIAADIASTAKKPVLVIIDDLDKTTLPAAESLFHQHISLLQQPNVPIVYTVPIAVFYTHQFTAISEGRYFLPSIKLFTRNEQKRVSENFALLRRMIGKRMSYELVSDEAIEHMVMYSGGILRDLTRMVQRAAMEAMLNDRPQISLADAQQASVELRNDFHRMLTSENLTALAQLARGETIPLEQKAPLLYIAAAVEYVNDAIWEDVHPIVRSLLPAAE